jgi:uncharacterized tellurite resistance protein B-like protein
VPPHPGRPQVDGATDTEGDPLFDRNPAAPDRGGHDIEPATAALPVELVRIDRDTSPAEREAALRAVHEKFGLSGAEADAPIALAEAQMRQPLHRQDAMSSSSASP